MNSILYAVLACGLLSLLWIAARKSVVLCQLSSMALLVCSAVFKRARLTLRVKWYKWVRSYKPVATDADNPANKPAPHVIMKRPGARVKVME